jgi:hypothetical protein
LDALVQSEPAEWVEPDTVGFVRGDRHPHGAAVLTRPRLKAIPKDSLAVAIAIAIARSNALASRDPRTPIYPDRQWLTPFVGGSYQFLNGAERLFDARAMFFY